MSQEQIERLRKTTELHRSMEAREALRRVAAFSGNPRAMQYFYALCEASTKDVLPCANGAPVIGTTCMQVPNELIIAAGGKPIRLCNGSYSFDKAGTQCMPAKSCSLARATAGMLEIHNKELSKTLKTIVVPTTCDLKRKSIDLYESLGYSVYVLEMPASKDSEISRFFWRESVKKFAVDLKKYTKQRITKKSLQSAIHKVSRATELSRQLYALRNTTPAVLLGKDALLVYNSYFFDDVDKWCAAVEQLIAELLQRKKEGFSAGNKRAPRLLLTGSPLVFPNLKIPLLLEESGAVIVADELCSSSRMLYDAVVYDEKTLDDMISGIADRYLKPCTCPCLTQNQDRERKLLNMAETFKIDGVVYQAHSGCMVYEMEQRGISSALAKHGIPMLYLETDYSPEDSGQLSTRIEAFIESIKVKRRKAQ